MSHHGDGMAVAADFVMTTVPTAPRRILILDDDDATRRGLTALMSGAGYVALPARTLQEATEALEREAPDLIITDVRLQGYNGLQLLAMGSRPIPAIVVTGFPDRAHRGRRAEDGRRVPRSSRSRRRRCWRSCSRSSKPARPTRIFSATRRYARKPVTRQLKAWVQDLPVRILDISYGGLRLGDGATRRRSGCRARCR